MFPARERGDLGVSRPEEVENAAGTRHAVCLSPAPGGVDTSSAVVSGVREPEPRPRGSRIRDVTSAHIVPGGLARIECRRIPSR